jgi:thioredoxin-related protein
MRKLVAVALAALSLGIAVPLNAAREEPTKPLQRLELLVIEVAGCTVCDLVRVHIQPAYESSPRARQVPLRYVDITSRDELEMGLAERVETVPTIVLMRDGREVDRISGYMGPENFFAALGQMLELAATD